MPLGARRNKVYRTSPRHKGATTLKYDNKKNSRADIKKGVDATGYKATSIKTLNE